MLKIKITIDTKEDSHEEIRKVIKLLSHLIGEERIYSNKNIFDDSSPAVTHTSGTGSVFGNLFGSTDSDTAENPNQEATNPEHKPPRIQIIDY